MHHYSQEFVYVDKLSQESLREHQLLSWVHLGFHLLKQSQVWSDTAFSRTSRPARYRSHTLTSQLEELPGREGHPLPSLFHTIGFSQS